MQSNSQRRRTRQDKKRRRTRENCKLWISQNIFVRVVRPSVRWLFGEWNRLESPWPFQFSDHFLRLARSGFTLLVERVFNYSRDGARRWRRNEMEKLIIKKGDPFLMTCFLFVLFFHVTPSVVLVVDVVHLRLQTSAPKKYKCINKRGQFLSTFCVPVFRLHPGRIVHWISHLPWRERNRATCLHHGSFGRSARERREPRIQEAPFLRSV